MDEMERATRTMMRRLEYELLGAWRAGYDYVHVYGEAAVSHEPAAFALRQYVLPSNTERPPNPAGRIYRYTYDIGGTSDAELREASRR